MLEPAVASEPPQHLVAPVESPDAAPTAGEDAAGGETGRPSDGGRPVEIGLLLAPTLDKHDRKLVDGAARRAREVLRQRFPGFSWWLSVTPATPEATPGVSDPVSLLDRAASLLEAQHLDFALYVAPMPLDGFGGPRLSAVSSQLLGCAIVAAREQPRRSSRARNSEAALAERLLTALGLLNGLSADESPPLDGDWDPELSEQWQRAFDQVADPRLEERRSPIGEFGFYLRSLRVNRREIRQAVARARPWQFPRRLSRLMAGAVSTGTIVLLTAEAWDLSTVQTWASLTILGAVALFGSVFYLLSRQNLLSQLHAKHLSERRVIAEVATCVGLALGMLATFFVLLAGTFVLASALYTPDLIARWAPAAPAQGPWVLLKVAIFSASLGIAVGGLGASFEAPSYFRFVLIVDEVVEQSRRKRHAPLD